MESIKKFFSIILCLFILIGSVACAAKPEGDNTMVDNIQELTERKNVREALCGTDALGREISPAGETNGKLVGLFYLLWLGNDYSDKGEPYFDGIYDMSKMAFSEIYSSGGTPFVKHHFYAEPLFGYYNMQDYWVVERHVQMFIAAGLDFLAIDSTNNSIYQGPLTVLLEILEKYRVNGYKVPKIMFLTNTNSHQRVEQLYNFLYKDGRYQELWFNDEDEGRNPDKKPWVTMRVDQKVYLTKAVRDTFYFRDSQWPNESFKDNGFPWIEFTRPQPVHNGVISVSVAQNSGMHMSNSVQYENSPNNIDYYNQNWGRGYTSVDGVNSKDRINEGSNFQEQWDVAMASDARIVMLLEWNEWTALKLATEVSGVGNTVVFFDCASVEFSRDIEPIKGYYGDNFYMQMIKNMRAFRGESGKGISINNADISSKRITDAWNLVTSGVADFSGQKTRDYINSDGSATYTNTTKRNDIVEIRVAQDEKNFYFLIKCDKNITEAEDENWLNLWIKTQSGNKKYDFVINRKREGNKAKVEDCSSGEIVGESYLVQDGKYLQLSVAKSLLNNAEVIDIKVSDNVDFSNDTMLLYVEGDSAPYGRLNYRFTVK